MSGPEATGAIGTALRDITARGLPAELWRPLLTGASEIDPAQFDRAARGPVVVVVPHPDDETLGAGGLLQRLAGPEPTLVFVTDGAAGYPGSTPGQQAELAVLRRAEAHAALQALGRSEARAVFLDVPDGTVADVEAELGDRLRPFFTSARLVLAPWPGDPHPDHQAVGRAAAETAKRVGVELWQYPIWMRHSIRPGDPRVEAARLRVVRLTAAEQAVKRAAIETHRSQLRSPIAGYGPVLPEHVLELFADGVEPFFLPSGSSGPAAPGALR